MNFSELTSHGGIFCDGDWIEKKDQDPNGNVRLIQLADIGVAEFKDKSHRYITEDKAIELHCTHLQRGDILIARLPDPLGRACIFPLEGKYITAVDIAVVRIANENYNSKYIMYMINSPQFRNEIKKYESGTTRKRISRKNLDKIQFKVPSRAEQNRIVARIEEFFSQLDSGIETLQKTKQQLEVYRQAVKKQSFDSNVGYKEISEILDDIRIGPFGTALHKSDYITGGVPVINPQHIKNNQITPNRQVTISKNKADELNSYVLKTNDIIMGRRGEMGRCAPVTENEAGMICGTGSLIFRLKPEYSADFYCHILSGADVIHYLEANATGTTMKNLNEEIVKHISVPIVTKERQAEISAQLDSALSMCESIDTTIDETMQKAEALRQSILKKAFEGNLRS